MAACKNLFAGASEEISSSQFISWDPVYISVTNGASKLKFGTVVGICPLGGVMGSQELPLFIL